MTREEAIEIARAAAKAKPQSYYAEPFEPHEWVVDAILAASHTQDDEIDRLRVNRDNSCTCPHQDAREPLTNHGKACPIRVNKVKRIAPEVAMERLAAALDASDLLISDCVGDPVHGHVPGHWVVCPVCVADRTGRPLEQDALRVAVDAVQRLISKAKQFERYPGGEGARRELRAALDALGVLDEDRRG